MTKNMFIKNLNGLRFVLILSILMLGVGSVWAGSTYKTAFTATTHDSGKGLVYASGPGTSTAPANDAAYGTSVSIGESSDTGSSSSKNTYYVWAKAARGYAFDGWTISGSNNGVSPTSSSSQSGVAVSVTSNKKNGTNTGTATANWKDATSVLVVFGVPVDGSYTVTYSYAVVKEGKFATEEKVFAMSESSTAASGQINSYAGDVVTVSTDASNFEGWYSNASFTGTALSTESSYSFTVSAATFVYAKFKSATKYYGKVAASIPAVPNSMPGGGTIYISNIAGTTGATFLETPQEAKITTFNSDATPPASMNQTFYLHAQPTDKRYTFRGWFDNETGTGTALSTNEDWEYTFAVSSHTESSPTTKTVYACFDFNLYYVEVFAESAVPGQGMVIVSGEKYATAPDYTTYSNESSALTYALRTNPKATVYLYAKGKYGYKLAGWYDNPECTGTSLGSANPLEYKPTASSIYPLDPTVKRVYAKFVAEDKINVTYNNPDHTKGEYKAYSLDIAEVDDEYIWSQTEIFSSEGKSANTVQSQYKTDVLILEAEPKSGYGVSKWYDGADKTSVSHLYQTSATAAKTVGVTFGDAKPFKAGDKYYVTLGEALTAVGNSGTITVVQNAFVAAGNYTIPSGVTLLVPYNDSYSSYTSPSSANEKNQAFGSATQYVMLTLGSNAIINVNGTINISANLNSAGGGSAGCGSVNAFGRIDMMSGSQIVVNNSANLYCWGFITGTEGLVTIKNGGKVHEPFQTQQNPGGSKAMAWNEKAFFMNQYYIQNVESPLKIEYGGIEQVYAMLYIQGYQHANTTFIGKDNTGMFALKSGSYLIRSFNPTTDRITYDIFGNAVLNYVSMSVYIDIDTRNYPMPITNNMSIKCHKNGVSAATLDINYGIELLPSSEVIIDEGVTANIKGKLIVYDRDEWVGKKFAGFTISGYNGSGDIITSSYSPTRSNRNIRTVTALVDAKFDLQGTLGISGALYTTTSGANICSTNGAGKITFTANAGTASSTIQYAGNALGTSTSVPMTAAKLNNGDNSYVATVGSVSGDQFIYSKDLSKWLKNPKTVTWDANGGIVEPLTTAHSEGSFIGELPAATKDGYDLVGWFTTADGGTQITPTTKVTATTTYYAHWTPKTYTITYKNQGESTFAGSTHIDTPNPHPTTHTFGTATALNGATREGYVFGGWYKTISCTGTAVTSLDASLCKNITLYAKWTRTYTITWRLDGKTVKTEQVAYGAMPDYGSTPSKDPSVTEEFTFSGWNPELAPVTKDQIYSGSFDAKPRQYTITWLNVDGSELDTTHVAYGEDPVYPNADPTYSDGAHIYTFTGWTPAIELVEKDATYTATYDVLNSLDVEDEMEIPISTNLETTTVHVSGSLSVAEGKKLKTSTLILEASPTGSGQITGDMEADVAYLDYTLGGSKAVWYDVAVPWEVDATTGIYVDGVRKQLNKDFFLIYYNGALRASQNKHSDACWQFVNKESSPDKFMHPGRLYMIYLSNAGVDTLRFERCNSCYGSGAIETPEIFVHKYDAVDEVNAGWNGIANPAIYKAYLNAGANTVEVGESIVKVPNYGQKYLPESDTYEAFNMDETPFRVSEPVFVQVAAEHSVVIDPTSFPALAAPVRKAKVDNAYYEVQIAAGEDCTDRIFLLVVEGKEERYRVGLDLAKAGVSTKVAQMWVSRYGSKLCVNTTAPKGTAATYPLTIQVPADGEYQINSATEMQDNQQMYVTFNGRAIWNLAYGPYEVFLTQGTHTEYGLKLVQSPAVTTDIENAEVMNGATGVRKVLIDNQIYIIREGAVYTINGQIVK